ncbi:DUF4363 family protein [Tenuibacillus multivorans]|uniref:DUF4363 family protein n=1 Tax=Tenuibacillus multivorans TaxID=237069 RepID=A0A1G9ZWU6_9BACI|nr:DUF4363 family protein [Tenuibacillus multivorans]GEL76880.1 hypothetical protein TMU01_11150 [Tenuibacillus multivorans]SDN25607.1 protein of unknown function [Tenuibacillus multivorans]
MKTLKISIIWLCLTTILFGCSEDYIQKKPLPQKAIEIESLVNQSDWDKARKEVKHIEKIYNKNKWMYQLLGNSTEYNYLDQHIKQLSVSVEEKDQKEAKFNLKLIEHYIESIYFR